MKSAQEQYIEKISGMTQLAIREALSNWELSESFNIEVDVTNGYGNEYVLLKDGTRESHVYYVEGGDIETYIV